MQDLTFCYQLQKLNLVYLHKWVSLLLYLNFIVCLWQNNLLAFSAEILVELVSFSMIN